MGQHPGKRMVAHSHDGGASLEDFAIDETLTTPVTAHWSGIVASVVRAAPGVLVYSSATNPSRRANMALRLSRDDGASWSNPKTLWSGPSAYSDVARVNE